MRIHLQILLYLQKHHLSYQPLHESFPYDQESGIESYFHHKHDTEVLLPE